jgi:hypothetical protein
MAPPTTLLVECDILCCLQQSVVHDGDDKLCLLTKELCSDQQISDAIALLCEHFDLQRSEDSDDAVAWLVANMRVTQSVDGDASVRFVSANLGFFEKAVEIKNRREADTTSAVDQQELQRLSLLSEQILQRLNRLEYSDGQTRLELDTLRRAPKANENTHRPSLTSNVPSSVREEPPPSQVAQSATVPPRGPQSYLAAAQSALPLCPRDLLPSSSGGARASTSLPDGDGFQFQKRRRPPIRCGTATTSSGLPSTLQGVQRRAHIFVTSLGSTTTVDQVKEHCTARGIGVVSCERVDARAPHSLASFHIAVNFDDRDKVLNDEFWPSYVRYRPWRFISRSQNTQPNGE